MRMKISCPPPNFRKEDTPTLDIMNFANLLSDGCHDFEIRPHLQLLLVKTFAHNSTSDYARLDIKANGLWESRFNTKTLCCKTNFVAKKNHTRQIAGK